MSTVTKEYMDETYPNWTRFYFGKGDAPNGMLKGPPDVPRLSADELTFARNYNKENRLNKQGSHVNLKEITVEMLDKQTVEVTRALAYVKLSNCQDVGNVLKAIGKSSILPASSNNYDKLTHKDIKTMEDGVLGKYTKYIFNKSNNYSELFKGELEANKDNAKFVSEVKKAMDDNTRRKEAKKQQFKY
jgi:hypothetical protein